MNRLRVCFSVEKSGVQFASLSNLVRLFVVLLRNVLSVLITISTVIHKALFFLISCKKCGKQYVGSTITSFRYRFNNHKSSLTRFGRGQRGICGEHLYSHFFSKGHSGLTNVSVQIIDKTDIRDPTTGEGFWTHKLKCFTPLGLNIMDI